MKRRRENERKIGGAMIALSPGHTNVCNKLLIAARALLLGNDRDKVFLAGFF